MHRHLNGLKTALLLGAMSALVLLVGSLFGRGGVLIAFVVALVVIDRLTPQPSGPRSSSYATSPPGLAAYFDVLRRSGHAVRRLRLRCRCGTGPR